MLEIFWLLPLAILFQEGECSEKKVNTRKIKSGKCPKPRKKEERKSEREVKMDKCPTLELGVQEIPT